LGAGFKELELLYDAHPVLLQEITRLSFRGRRRQERQGRLGLGFGRIKEKRGGAGPCAGKKKGGRAV
jgi:hypothetical protein